MIACCQVESENDVILLLAGKRRMRPRFMHTQLRLEEMEKKGRRANDVDDQCVCVSSEKKNRLYCVSCVWFVGCCGCLIMPAHPLTSGRTAAMPTFIDRPLLCSPFIFAVKQTERNLAVARAKKATFYPF